MTWPALDKIAAAAAVHTDTLAGQAMVVSHWEAQPNLCTALATAVMLPIAVAGRSVVLQPQFWHDKLPCGV